MNIIYIRTSTEEQNPQNQIKDCLSINKYGEVEIVEEKQSAWKDKDRPKFEEIKKQIKKGNIKHLICWDWDRLFRNRVKFIEFFKFCEIYNCKIHSFRQQYFEDFYKIPAPFNEIVSNIVLQLMGHTAEEESKKKSDRVKLAVRKEKGKVTKSYKGNKWGRKTISKKTIKEVMELNKQRLSVRDISKKVFYWDKSNNKKNIGKSTVHKIIAKNKGENN